MVGSRTDRAPRDEEVARDHPHTPTRDRARDRGADEGGSGPAVSLGRWRLSFGDPIRPTFDGQAPIRLLDVIAFDNRILAIGLRNRSGPCVLAISDDGSPSFTTRDLGDFTIASTFTSSADVAVLVGSIAGVPSSLRSRDEGRTWTSVGAPANVIDAILGGRWFVIERDIGVHVSDDDGDSWTLVIEGAFTRLAPDHADPSCVYALIRGVVLHIVVA